MISDERAEKAVEYIRDHADEIGQLRGQKAYLEHHAKVILATEFLHATGTVAERDHTARASQAYLEAVQDIKDCVTELETVLTHFKAAELTVEVWRTQAANQRRGNI